jgi:hypothetical protein
MIRRCSESLATVLLTPCDPYGADSPEKGRAGGDRRAAIAD